MPAVNKTAAERWLPALLLVTVLSFWGGFMTLGVRGAMLDDPQTGAVAALFPGDYTPNRIYAALRRADGRLVNTTWLDRVWIVYSDAPGFVGRLRDAGAVAAFRPSLLRPLAAPGCYLSPALVR